MSTHDSGKHLFLDDREIHQTIGTKRVMNQPVKHPEPIIMADDVSERMVSAWGNVIKEKDGRLRM